MAQLVVLNLGKGNEQQGFPTVTAQVWASDSLSPIQVMGSLPPYPDLAKLWRRWRSFYHALHNRFNQRNHPLVEFLEDAITNVSEIEFHQICQQLESQLNRWLSKSSFRTIDQRLRTKLALSDEVRVIIEAEDEQTRRLPWHLWHFFEDYPQAEVALGTPEYEQVKTFPKKHADRVRILAVLGNSQGIDIQQDRALLEQLPEAEVVFLVEPERRELDRQLWDDQGWDILFFAGHSASYILPEQDQQNYLEINHSDRFTIPQFKHALRAAIVRGLQIAILNSCDGLGLARQLADLQLPQLIVMREAVPDQVAQEFLKQWLKSFAAGQSFYQSVRIAREQLQGWENEFPCASWLPVICQNPAARPLNWNELHPLPEVAPPRRKSALLSQFLYRCRTSLLLSFAVTTIVMILRLMGLLQPIELWAFDRLLQLRPPEGIDNRLLIVTITEQDIQQQGQYPLSDTTLLSALKILDADQPIAIGLDIYRDVPVGSGYREFAAYLQDNPRLITTCEVGEPGSEKPDQVGVPPPPTSPETNRSFSDISVDPDGIVRRHLFHLDTGESPCSASYALSAELAFRYLDQVGIPIQSFHGNLQLGNTIFDPLENHIGFYQTIDARGHQVLLNYRATPHIAREVTLAQVLNHTVPPDWVKGQIVLIGVTAPSVGDTFATPYGTGINRNIPGVTLHAVMVSHLIRVASGERSLLRFWQPWGDVLWISGWVGVESFLVSSLRKLQQRRLVSGVTIVIQPVIGFVALLEGICIPLIPSILALSLSWGLIRYSLASTANVRRITKP